MYRSHHSSATSKLCSYQTVLGLTTLAVRVWCLRSLFNKSKHGSSRSRIQIPLCPPEGVKKFKSPCNPPFSKGEMLKRESASVDRKYLRIPLFRVRVPLFGKEGLGEICGVRSGLQFFSQLPFFKGGFNLAPLWKSMS